MKFQNIDNRADYAEMFESIPEFSSTKIPRGTSVVFEGDKIRPAKKNETPFGVVSSFPIMIGNNAKSSEWTGKYLKDEFGNFIWEEKEVWSLIGEKDKKNNSRRVFGVVGDKQIPIEAKVKKKLVRKVNPDYDPLKEYVPRIKRTEWNAVALVGKVKILKGQPVDKRWLKLKDISENVEEWLIR